MASQIIVGALYALDKAPLAHPDDLDELAFLYDHGDRVGAAGELEHLLVGLAVLFYVVLHKVYPTLL